MVGANSMFKNTAAKNLAHKEKNIPAGQEKPMKLIEHI
jgi:hypothetical protein